VCDGSLSFETIKFYDLFYFNLISIINPVRIYFPRINIRSHLASVIFRLENF
jgi:hypothetical protein